MFQTTQDHPYGDIHTHALGNSNNKGYFNWCIQSYIVNIMGVRDLIHLFFFYAVRVFSHHRLWYSLSESLKT